MSDFLNSIDPTNLAVVVRNLVQRVGMLEARLGARAQSPNGQMELTDDGILLNDVGYGIQHETLLNNVLRRWRLGSYDVASEEPAAVVWDYYQELGGDLLANTLPSDWTHDTNTATIVWDLSGADVKVSFVSIGAAESSTATSPYFPLTYTYDALWRGVYEAANSSGKVWNLSGYLKFYDAAHVQVGSSVAIGYISNLSGGTSDTSDVASVPETATCFQLTLTLTYAAQSGTFSADIYFRTDPDLAARSQIKACIDLFRKAYFDLMLTGTYNTSSVTVTGAATGSWDASKKILSVTVTASLADTISGTSTSRLYPCAADEMYYFILNTTQSVFSGTKTAYLEASWYDVHRALIQTDTLDSMTISGANAIGSIVSPANAVYVSIQFRAEFASGGYATSASIAFNTDKIRVWIMNLNQMLMFDRHLGYTDGINGTIDLRLPFIHVRNEQAANTAGGTFTAGAWRTRVLNTMACDTHSLASLASNQIKLPAGVYRVWARCPAHAVDRHKARIYNISATATLLVGSSGFAPGDGDSVIFGRFALGAASLIELQHYGGTTKTTDGMGVASNVGEVEVYAEIMLWKEQ